MRSQKFDCPRVRTKASFYWLVCPLWLGRGYFTPLTSILLESCKLAKPISIFDDYWNHRYCDRSDPWLCCLSYFFLPKAPSPILCFIFSYSCAIEITHDWLNRCSVGRSSAAHIPGITFAPSAFQLIEAN